MAEAGDAGRVAAVELDAKRRALPEPSGHAVRLQS
jgi:hypothetical protein